MVRSLAEQASIRLSQAAAKYKGDSLVVLQIVSQTLAALVRDVHENNFGNFHAIVYVARVTCGDLIKERSFYEAAHVLRMIQEFYH